ncbi:MAG: VWA domain-containing protein [Bryobacteraceae bacterium]|nr:VWA domain-containing protein [Bryobacteraceae bacterium]
MRPAVALALFIAAAPAAWPQQAPTIRADANEILVDVVVRDRKGKLVRGLKQSDFTVLEAGVPQTVTSLRELRGPSAVDAEPGAQPAAEEVKVQGTIADSATMRVNRQIRLVSMVFERLGQDGRRLAREAALEFLERDYGPNVYYAVISVDQGFRILQSYTNDREKLRAVIDKFGTMAPTDFANEFTAGSVNEGGAARLTNAVVSALNTGNASSTVNASFANSPQVDLAAFSTQQMARSEANMREFALMLTRDQLGKISVFSLWAVIDSLAKLPGRKSVLYFSEGMVLPNGVWDQFRGLINAANRANVTVYAIDARGLSPQSETAPATAMMAAAAARSANYQLFEDALLDERFQMRTADMTLDSIRANAQQALRELAESTGGYLLANQNDFRPVIRKLSEEFHSYYELTYRPANTLYDGKFRPIEVRLNRKDVVVQARDGYYALPAIEGQMVFPYEVPLLKALSRSTPPADLAFRSAILPFTFENGVQRASLVFDLPLADVAFTKLDETRTRTNLSVLALVKDEAGHVVSKVSRNVPLEQPLEKVEGFRKGRFIVTRPLELPPGRYTLETVAADHEGNRFGVRRAVHVVASPAEGPRLSGLALLRRVEPMSSDPDPADPLHMRGARIVPTLDETVTAGPNTMVSIYLIASPNGLDDDPELYIDILRDGKLMRRDKMPIERSSVVPYIARTPIQGFAPGRYELRATLVQGSRAAQRSIPVTIE